MASTYEQIVQCDSVKVNRIYISSWGVLPQKCISLVHFSLFLSFSNTCFSQKLLLALVHLSLSSSTYNPCLPAPPLLSLHSFILYSAPDCIVLSLFVWSFFILLLLFFFTIFSSVFLYFCNQTATNHFSLLSVQNTMQNYAAWTFCNSPLDYSRIVHKTIID